MRPRDARMSLDKVFHEERTTLGLNTLEVTRMENDA